MSKDIVRALKDEARNLAKELKRVDKALASFGASTVKKRKKRASSVISAPKSAPKPSPAPPAKVTPKAPVKPVGIKPPTKPRPANTDDEDDD